MLREFPNKIPESIRLLEVLPAVVKQGIALHNEKYPDFKIKCVVLFGSVVRGVENPEDLDMIISTELENPDIDFPSEAHRVFTCFVANTSGSPDIDSLIVSALPGKDFSTDSEFKKYRRRYRGFPKGKYIFISAEDPPEGNSQGYGLSE